MSGRRVKMTKKMFRETLVGLMREKPLAQITIRELCAEADLNRSTFYAHYDSIYDLYRETEEEFLSHMVFVSGEETDPGEALRRLTGLAVYLKEHRNTFFALMENGTFNSLCAKHAKKLARENQNLASPARNQAVFDLCTSFSIAGVNALFAEWLTNQSQMTPEDVARLVYQATSRIERLTPAE